MIQMMAIYHSRQDSWWIVDRPEETLRFWAETWPDVIIFFINVNQEI